MRVDNTELNDLLQNQSIVLQGLSKCYGRLLAVDDLTVGIGQGECFGLLGVNGAGKTSTFQMLTGELMATGGHAYVGRHSVSSQIKQVNK